MTANPDKEDNWEFTAVELTSLVERMVVATVIQIEGLEIQAED